MIVRHVPTADALFALLDAHRDVALTGQPGSLTVLVVSAGTWDATNDPTTLERKGEGGARYVLRLQLPADPTRSAWKAYYDANDGRLLNDADQFVGGGRPGTPDVVDGRVAPASPFGEATSYDSVRNFVTESPLRAAAVALIAAAVLLAVVGFVKGD